MAKASGVSPAQVQRIWAARALKPHRVDPFKLSNDALTALTESPQFCSLKFPTPGRFRS